MVFGELRSKKSLIKALVNLDRFRNSSIAILQLFFCKCKTTI